MTPHSRRHLSWHTAQWNRNCAATPWQRYGTPCTRTSILQMSKLRKGIQQRDRNLNKEINDRCPTACCMPNVQFILLQARIPARITSKRSSTARLTANHLQWLVQPLQAASTCNTCSSAKQNSHASSLEAPWLKPPKNHRGIHTLNLGRSPKLQHWRSFNRMNHAILKGGPATDTKPPRITLSL